MKNIMLAIFLCLGLAHSAAADNTQDPYERYNRAMFAFNDKADHYFMQPVARGYRKITPKPIRRAVMNFFDNLRDMQSFGHNVLRGKPKQAGYDFMRVAINSTFGMGGLINIADEAGMPSHKTTLGDTFATWGWKNSNYLMLPLLGPSTVRDGLGSGVSLFYMPEFVQPELSLRVALPVLNGIQQREALLETTDTLEHISLDKYLVMRDAYIALRNQELGIENPPEELPDPEEFLETSAPNPQQNAAEPSFAAP